MVDVTFKFEKIGSETLEVVKTVHDKGKFQPFFPVRIVFDTPFEITIQDMGGLPVEGVAVSVNNEKQGDTDHNGKISITIPKE